MSVESWMEWTPVFLHHFYWHKKEQFMLESDRYTFWTMFAVEEGRFSYRIGGHEGTAKFPELVLCPPGMDFERTVLEPVSFHFIAFNLRPPGPDYPAMPIPGSCKLTLGDTKRLSSTYGHLRTTARQPGTAGERWASQLLRDIWEQHLFEKKRTPEAYTDEFPQTDDPQIIQAYRLIREQACSPISLSAVAADLGLTPVQLTRRYQAAFGASPSEHVTSLRMQKACALLMGTTYSLEKIAEECGYENGFYLSRIFSKRMGVSPSAYRKTYRV
jgi:AraC family transcriptional regulator